MSTTDYIPGFEDVQAQESPGDEEKQAYAFETLDEFVTEVLLPLYPQVWGGHNRWCAYWRKHEAAVGRLDAVWHAWEAARHDRAAVSAWLQSSADYHMGVLMDQHGTFDGCSIGTIEEPDFKHAPRTYKLPSAPAPDGLFMKYPTA